LKINYFDHQSWYFKFTKRFLNYYRFIAYRVPLLAVFCYYFPEAYRRMSVCLYLLPPYPGELNFLSFPAIAYGRAEADSSSLFVVVHHVREAIPALPMSFTFPNACHFALSMLLRNFK
jgi:hypothetical protein